ncbi:N-formylglutamate amidohydrolase [Agaribacterium haliotis]|uniref:N-formylglutamate amidohydrolase n=1 Tax=Agaribacterium haliotis TaxID=2013869 RepID=UPI000BB5530F|nr:N-formylglutamate amidohydrolase [Agaribacterium haliotis]
MMLSEEEICARIQRRECFKASIEGGGFSIKIDSYLPCIAAAIHNGTRLREELKENCLLSHAERYFEEDPHTGTFIDDQQITLIANDSRYEYDLNRATSNCVYDTAWGKDCWKQALSETQKQTSLAKHAQFYRIVSVLCEALIEDFGAVLVIDTHSYNWRRFEDRHTPVFNLGTSSVKGDLWRASIDCWLNELNNISVDGIDIDAAENDVFFGKGQLAAHCHGLYDNVLVLATEFKKVFMDERSGEAYDSIIQQLKLGYGQAIQKTLLEFSKLTKSS